MGDPISNKRGEEATRLRWTTCDRARQSGRKIKIRCKKPRREDDGGACTFEKSEEGSRRLLVRGATAFLLTKYRVTQNSAFPFEIFEDFRIL